MLRVTIIINQSEANRFLLHPPSLTSLEYMYIIKKSVEPMIPARNTVVT